jgi:hypothetical protein
VPSLRLAALVAVLVLAYAGVLAPAAVAGNVDAAHACQQGGYAGLRGTDGTLFKNTGDCVAFVAKGGFITNVSTDCSFVAGTSGCVELDNVRIYSGTFGNVDLTSWTSFSGMFTFAPASGYWGLYYPGDTSVTITGSGTWTTSGSASGTWGATHQSVQFNGQFADGSGLSTCAAATYRSITPHLDLSQGGTVVGNVEMQILQAGNPGIFEQGYAVSPSGEPWGVHATSTLAGVTIRC